MKKELSRKCKKLMKLTKSYLTRNLERFTIGNVKVKREVSKTVIAVADSSFKATLILVLILAMVEYASVEMVSISATLSSSKPNSINSGNRERSDE